MTKKDLLIAAIGGIVLELAILAHLTFAAEPVIVFDLNTNAAGLRWDANTEPDMHHYCLYAHFGDSTAILVTVTHPDTAAMVTLGLRYFYERVGFTLTAIDQAGNESAHSNMVEAIFCQEAGTLYADVTADGMVDVEDLEWCRASLGALPWYVGWRDRADVNADRVIDVEDLERIRTRLGRQQ